MPETAKFQSLQQLDRNKLPLIKIEHLHEYALYRRQGQDRQAVHDNSSLKKGMLMAKQNVLGLSSSVSPAQTEWFFTRKTPVSCWSPVKAEQLGTGLRKLDEDPRAEHLHEHACYTAETFSKIKCSGGCNGPSLPEEANDKVLGWRRYSRLSIKHLFSVRRDSNITMRPKVILKLGKMGKTKFSLAK